MTLHIPTLLLSIAAVSFVLSFAIAVVGYPRKRELMLWALALALHGVAFTLFLLRGQVSDLLSIVVANTAIASIFAIFAEGLLSFVSARFNRLILWAPVAITAVMFYLALDDYAARFIAGSVLFGCQGLLLLYLIYRHLAEVRGRGKYIFTAGVVLVTAMMFVRIVSLAAGYEGSSAITTPTPAGTAQFMISITSIVLLVIGLLLMTLERDEAIIQSSETRMRTLYESTSDAVMLLDARGFFDCNPATLMMFGCRSKDEFVGKSPADLSPARQSSGSSSRLLAEEEMALAMRESTNRFEWEHKRLDTGQVFPAEVLLNSMSIGGRKVLQAVVRDISERKKLQLELERQAHLDYLTELFNRRYFMKATETELARAARYGNKLSLLMIDIDDFKRINDTYGHKAGDLVLQRFAILARQALREADVIGRIGGEEFAVLLPETDTAEAVEVAERLRQDIATAKVSIDHGLPIAFTISIGVASLKSGEDNIDVLFNVADKMLYAAKNSGRNRVFH